MSNKNSTINKLECKQEKFKVATHDLNNLLNNILSSVELLKETTHKDLNQLNLTKHIENNTLLASEIIQQLSGKNDIIHSNKAKINVCDIIVDTTKLFNKNGETRILFNFNPIDSDFTILGFSTDIKRVLLNLFTNAKEASDNNVLIKISVEELFKGQSPLIKLSISDNGNGIEESLINKIFDDGFSSKGTKNNSGKGLTIVKEIMDSHSGHIEVLSTINKGTTFNLYFPATTSTQFSQELSNKRIIIAEDDKFQREVLKDLLTSMKLNVFTASNGIEALELYTSTKPDLLFIDESMPGMTGLECSEKIREIDTTSQIVLVTGSDTEIEIGNVTKVLRKPYNFEMIKSTLRDLL